MASQYFLPNWVHVCLPEEGAVFLDVRRDRYFGLDQSQTRAFCALFQDSSPAHEDAQAVARQLLEMKLLTTEASDARPLAHPAIGLPEASVLEPTYDSKPKIRFHHLANFAMACAAVRLAMKLGSTDRATSRFSTLRARLTAKPAVSARGPEYVSELVKVFVYLRPLIYAAKDNCLYDSLVLGDFLRRYHVPSTCVFAVRTRPFAAHCWVQVDALIANGTVEFARWFVPILAV
jgi:hypothetical protein